MTEQDFALTEEKLELVNKCIKYAEEHFSEYDSKRYGEVCWWDDGDFRVRVVHSMDDSYDNHTHHGEAIKFKASAGRIVYSEYKRDMLGHQIDSLEEYVIEEVEW